jgi:hypothetical protein
MHPAAFGFYFFFALSAYSGFKKLYFMSYSFAFRFRISRRTKKYNTFKAKLKNKMF